MSEETLRSAWRDAFAHGEPVDQMLGRPKGYWLHGGLGEAVHTALLLGQPLLLTGEPGTGKTLLAEKVALDLGLGTPIKFEAKSTTTARDLFYSYDHMQEFRDAQRPDTPPRDPVEYIDYNALGLAILRANRLDAVAAFLSKRARDHFDGPTRSVVLIDEIDKTPRDVPNDILNELERGYFRIAEMGYARIAAPSDSRPVVVITSNSEKHLPEAFLRRCVYFDIAFPGDEDLWRITSGRLGGLLPGYEGERPPPLFTDALELVRELRRPGQGFSKIPGTGELLVWLIALQRRGVPADGRLGGHRDALDHTLGVLFKTRDDTRKARAFIDRHFAAARG